MRFIILVTGYNCEKYVSACISSLMQQTYSNWHAILISDGSTDGTHKLINMHAEQNPFKFKAIGSKKNIGAAYHRWFWAKWIEPKDDDVFVLVGMDDRLTKDCLKKLRKAYHGGAWATYGNWKSDNGIVNELHPINKRVEKERSWRRSKWITTALNTFKAFLFKAIKHEDLQYPDGKWLDNCTDLAIMFPVLEQCPVGKIVGIKDPIYIYNQHDNSTLSRFGKAHKTKAREHLKTIPKKSIYED